MKLPVGLVLLLLCVLVIGVLSYEEGERDGERAKGRRRSHHHEHGRRGDRLHSKDHGRRGDRLHTKHLEDSSEEKDDNKGGNKDRSSKRGADETRRGRNKNGFRLGKNILPEWILPWMKGDVSLGSGVLDIDWDIAELFEREHREWWKGPNVCVTREEKEDQVEEDDVKTISKHHVYTTTVCDETATTYTCTTGMGFFGKTKTFTVMYECCHGYERVPGELGCTTALELKNITSTLEELGTDELLKAVEAARLQQSLIENNVTIFAPTDAAFQLYKPPADMTDVGNRILVISPEMVELAVNMEQILISHMVPGFQRTSSMKDEQLIDTVYPRIKIRINHFEQPTRMMTANCVPVRSADHMATNGVVHIVDRVLPTAKHSIIDIVSKDPQLSMFKTVIGRTGLFPMLKKGGQYTVFAPTDAAFNKLEPSLRDKLLQGDECLGNVAKNHILPNVICSAIVEGKAKTRNILEKFLNMSRTAAGKLFVNSAQIVKKDIMATNGVVHIVDDILIPDEALGVLEVAQKEGTSQMVQLIKAAGLSKMFERLDNFTIFLPSNEAIKNLPEETLQLLSRDPEELSKLVKYHVVISQEMSEDFYNDLQLATLDSDKTLQVKDYSSFPFSMKSRQTVQCATITKSNIESCNGLAHLIDQVLLPPRGDVLDTLYQDKRFTKLVALLKKAEIAERLQLSGPFTIFAPTNQAFDSLSEDTLQRLTGDPSTLQNFLKYHIIQDSLCCAGVFESHFFWTPREHALDGSFLAINRKDGVILVDETPIAMCDITATNGVVHALNQVLPHAVQKYARPPRRRWGWGRQNGHHGNGGQTSTRFWDSLMEEVREHMDGFDDHIAGMKDTAKELGGHARDHAEHIGERVHSFGDRVGDSIRKYGDKLDDIANWNWELDWGDKK